MSRYDVSECCTHGFNSPLKTLRVFRELLKPIVQHSLTSYLDIKITVQSMPNHTRKQLDGTALFHQQYLDK